jgi:hypothetical protein
MVGAITPESSDQAMIAESLLLQARAYCGLPRPQYWNANRLLIQVTTQYSKALSSMDMAAAHEFHGIIRQGLRAQNALNSFQEAKNIFATLKDHRGPEAKEARNGYDRVSEQIDWINQNSKGEILEEPATVEPLSDKRDL